MGSEYTRNDAANNIADGNVISAADLDGEFDRLVTAFAAGSGHSHDGTAGEGGFVTELLGTAIKIGDGTVGTDIVVTFDGESNDGVLTWMEGNSDDYFKFSDDIRMNGTEKIQFGDAATFIQQSSDGVMRIDGEATITMNATSAISLVSDAITLGENGDTDIVLTFNANSADGVLTWMEDEDYFKFSDDILMNSTEKIQFGDTASFIQQSSDGVLRIDGEATINLNATAGITLVSDAIFFGENGDTDVVLTFNANSADGELKWMEDEDYFEFSDDILMASTEKVQFRDTALAIYSSTDGQLDIDADEELEITAPIVDIDASTRVDISGDLTVGDDLTLGSDGAILNFGEHSDIVVTHVHDTGLNISSVTAGDLLVLTSTEGGTSAGPNLVLNRDSASPANNDYAGSIIFKADDDGNNSTTIASITTQMIDVGASSEDSNVVFNNIVNSSLTAQLTLSSTGVTANTDLTVTDDLTVGDDLTFSSDGAIVTFGIDSDTTLTHNDGRGLLLNSTNKLEFRDTGLYINSSTDGQLDVDADTELELTAPTVDIAASTAVTIATPSLIISDNTADEPIVQIKNTHNGTSAGELRFVMDKGSAGADGDDLGTISFYGDDTGQAQTAFAKIIGEISESDNTDEAGKLTFYVAESDGTNTALTAGLVLEGEHATDGEVDVTIGAGTASTTSVVGNLTVGDNLTLGTDSSVINMGDGNDVTFTHDGTTGLTIAANPFEVDSGGNITLDSHTGIWIFEDADSEVLRITEGNSGDVTIKLAEDGNDLIFTDHGNATNMKILDAAVGINVPGEVQTTKIAYTDGDDAMTVADGGKVSFSAAAVGKQYDMPSAGSSLTPDFGAHSHFWIDANAPFTINNPSNTENKGQSGLFIFTHNGGARTCSIGTEYMIAGGGTSVTLSTGGAGVVDVFPYYVYDTNKIVLGAPTLDVKA